MRRFRIILASVTALAVLAAAAAFAIHSRLAPPAQSSATSCSPRPCADAGGYRMNVTEVQRTDGIVRLEVTFRVDGRQNMHADPADFSLEQGGHVYHPAFDGDTCPAWSRIQIPDGTSLGPKVLCFKPADPNGRLTLNWNPDLGITEYFSSGYNLPL